MLKVPVEQTSALGIWFALGSFTFGRSSRHLLTPQDPRPQAPTP